MKRHEADATSLVFGLVFLALVATWGLGSAGVLNVDAAGVLAPVALIGAGVIGLGVSLRRSRRAARGDDGEPAPPQEQVDDIRADADDTLVLDDDTKPS